MPYTASGGSFAVAKPRRWSDRSFPELAILCCSGSSAGIAPDGKRFVVPVLGEQEKGPPDVQALLNFYDELRRRFPSR